MTDLVIVLNCEIYGKILTVKGKSIFHNRHFLSSLTGDMKSTMPFYIIIITKLRIAGDFFSF
jgi:hypothetical protein